MLHDLELVAETRAWFQRAVHDLGAGAAGLAAEPSFTGDAVFHAQQVAEKSLKGYLTWHSRVFRKTVERSVRGRLALGHSSHCGLGLFLPASRA